MTQYKILSVDDASDNQFVIEELLEDLYQVELAFSGEECLQKLGQFIPDLILMDVSMPGMTGYQACEALKGLDATQNVPVIFLSAHITPEDKLKGYAVGGADYITKPFDQEELLVKIKTTLAISEKQRGLQTQLVESHAAAMHAMSYSSHLGLVVRFLEDSFSCHTLKELAERLFQSTTSLDLQCSVQIHAIDDVVDVSDSGVVYPLEQNVLTQGRTRGRFFEFRDKLIVNQTHTSLLVKNMPEDPDKRVEVKDILGVIINGLEARVMSILSELTLKTHQQTSLEQIRSIMKNIDEKFQRISRGAVTIVEEIMLEINEHALVCLLSEEQESELLRLTQKCIDKTNENFFTGLKLESEVNHLVEQMNQVLGKPDQ